MGAIRGVQRPTQAAEKKKQFILLSVCTPPADKLIFFVSVSLNDELNVSSLHMKIE